MTADERRTRLEDLERTSPDTIAFDLRVLASGKSEFEGRLAKDAQQSAGRFIQEACDINLPGIA